MNSRFGALMARMRSQRALSTLVILLTLTVGILIGTVLSRSGVRGNSLPDGSLLPAMQTPQQLSNTFGQVASAVEPAVVNVSTESTPKTVQQRRRAPNRGQRGQGGGDDPFQDFFDRFFGGQGGQGGQQGQQGDQGGDDDDQGGMNPFAGPGGQGGGRQRSLGSGVI